MDVMFEIKKNFIRFIIFFGFLHQSDQLFYYIFMVFPVCQYKIKECMEFLCVNNYLDDLFIKECMAFYNQSSLKFWVKIRKCKNKRMYRILYEKII